MSTSDSFEVEVEDEDKGLYKLSLDGKDLPPKRKIRAIWQKYGEKIVLAAGIILIAAASFEAGFLQGQKNHQDPIVVNQPACAPCQKSAENNATDSAKNTGQGKQVKSENQPAVTDSQKCAFVASKNSDKFHLASCQWAQRIKPENKVCFSSKEEAESRGFQIAKCCLK